jgi:hypothetical protein
MTHGFTKTALVIGTLLTASIPAVSFARDRGASSGSGRGNASRSTGSRGSSYGGRQSFVSPGGRSGGRYPGARGPPPATSLPGIMAYQLSRMARRALL